MLIAGGARRCGRTSNFPASVASCLCVLSLLFATLPEEARGQEGSDCETSHFDATEVPTAVPDPGDVTSSLVVPEGGRMDRVEVSVSVSHPFVSDLRLELVSPQGKRVVLAEAVGMWGDDFSGTTFSDQATTSIVSSLPPFSGQYRPVERLAAFSGSARAGTWKLKVTDLRARYSGTIEAWGLTLVSCSDVTPTRKRAGASDPPPLPEVPSGSEPVEGRLITVTSTSEVTDGDVSTVDALEANPGPDGISLREAIEATNNDPGTYTVQFDSSLAEATVELTNDLPVLRGGGVFIDGDIDGDGRPDVTLVNRAATGTTWAWGLNVASSGNRLHALALQGFQAGVVFTAMRSGARESLLKDQTFAQNAVTGLVLSDISDRGIWIAPAFSNASCERDACRTDNAWLDTRIVGNTIEAPRATDAGLEAVAGNVVRRLTIAGNDILMTKQVKGVALTAGGGAGSNDNRISDALVAHNAIAMRGSSIAANVIAGWAGARKNVVEDVRIVGNAARFSRSGHSDGVVITISDGCAGQAGAQQGSGICSRDNVVRGLEIVGNLLDGVRHSGVQVADPCCNVAPGTLIEDVRIANNVIEAVISAPTQYQNSWGVGVGGLAGDGGAGISNVAIRSNTIVQRTTKTTGQHPVYLTAGGIALVGGLGKAGTSIGGVSIVDNRVDTKLVGILLLGGGPSRERLGQDDAIGNRVTRVKIRGNVVARVPALATHWFSKLKGISLIGGVAGPARAYRGWKAKKNSVACVTLKDNAVAGRGRGVAVLGNLGAGASRNIARLGGC